MQPLQPWTEHTVSGITILLRPATRESLEQIPGSPPGDLNPLLDYPAILTGQKFLVLETRINSPQHGVQMVTNKTTLAFERAKPGFLASWRRWKPARSTRMPCRMHGCRTSMDNNQRTTYLRPPGCYARVTGTVLMHDARPEAWYYKNKICKSVLLYF